MALSLLMLTLGCFAVLSVLCVHNDKCVWTLLVVHAVYTETHKSLDESHKHKPVAFFAVLFSQNVARVQRHVFSYSVDHCKIYQGLLHYAITRKEKLVCFL